MSKLQVGINDLETWCRNNGDWGAQLIHEWVGKDEDGGIIAMTDVSYASARRVEWQCGAGHIWTSRVASRTSQHSGCPCCYRVDRGSEPVSITLAEWCKNNGEFGARIAREFVGEFSDGAPVTPDVISRGSSKFVKWKCDFGHEWCASPGARTSENSLANCPVCSKVFSYPEVWLYLALRQAFPQTEYRRKYFPCQGYSDGLEYDISIQLGAKLVLIEVSSKYMHRDKDVIDTLKITEARRNGASLICVSIDNYLTSSHIETSDSLIRFAVPGNAYRDYLFRVLEYILGLLESDKGTIDFALLTSEIQAAYSLDSEFIFTLEKWCQENGARGERLVKEWVGELEDGTSLSMRSVLAVSSTMRVKWKCSICGNTWVSPVRVRTSAACDCPRCRDHAYGRKFTTSLDDWCSVNGAFGEQLRSEWVGLDINSFYHKISEVGVSSGLKYLWHCRMGHFWFATLDNRTRVHTNCPVCSHRGTRNCLSTEEAEKLLEECGISLPETTL